MLKAEAVGHELPQQAGLGRVYTQGKRAMACSDGRQCARGMRYAEMAARAWAATGKVVHLCGLTSGLTSGCDQEAAGSAARVQQGSPTLGARLDGAQPLVDKQAEFIGVQLHQSERVG